MVDQVLSEFHNYFAFAQQNVKTTKSERADPFGLKPAQDYLRTLRLPVLTPEQISIVSSYLFENKVETYYEGTYLSKCIQQSYRKGHNEFHLYTNDSQPSYISYGLEGKQGKKLSLRIHGSIGSYFGSDSQDIDATIDGNVLHNLGSKSKRSSFIVDGDAALFVGTDSKKSKFTIKGDTGDFIAGHANACEFTFYGLIGSIGNYRPYSKNCIFNFKNERAYKIAYGTFMPGMHLELYQRNKDGNKINKI